MALYQQRSNEGMFSESTKFGTTQNRTFGREIHNIQGLNPRSQSIKGTTSYGQKQSVEIDTNISEQENGGKKISPRKSSMHVKHSSEIISNPQNHTKRFSSQIESTTYAQGNESKRLPVPQKFNQKEIEQELTKIAREDLEKPSLVSQYSQQIFEYLRNKEVSYKVNSYMERQIHISERMRCILIDWIVEAHKKFKLLPETLFMTVNIIDRYLELATCTREKLQLVGITALFIAAKYEEIYPPPLKDFVEMTQKTYSKTEILSMEGNIVCSLKFNLTVPSSLRFLERYSRVEKLDKKSQDMSQYLLELSLVEYKFIKTPESLKACAAIYLTNKLFKKQNCWSDVSAAHSLYSEHQIRATALDLCIILQGAPTSSTQAVRKKFLQPQYSEVATIQIEKINNGNLNSNTSNQNNQTNNQNYPPKHNS